MDKLFLALILVFTFSLFAEDHHSQTESLRPRAESKLSSTEKTDETISKIKKVLGEIDAFKSSGVEVPLGDMDEVLRIAEKQLQKSKKEGYRFMGEILSTDENGVLLDNITVFTEYVEEIMKLYQEDPSRTPGELRLMASENLSKKWKVWERVKKSGWTKLEKAIQESSDFIKKEIERRTSLVESKNPEVFEAFNKFLKDGFSSFDINFEKEFKDFRKDPLNYLDSNLDQWVKEVRKVSPELANELNVQSREYRKIKTKFQNRYENDIRGKDIGEISETVLNEMRKESREIRELESKLDSIEKQIKEKTEISKLRSEADKALDKAESEADDLKKRLEKEANQQVDDLKNRINHMFGR